MHLLSLPPRSVLSCLGISVPVSCRDPSIPGPPLRGRSPAHALALLLAPVSVPPSPPSPGPSFVPSLAFWPLTQRAVSNTSGAPLPGSSPSCLPHCPTQAQPLGGQPTVMTNDLSAHQPLCLRMLVCSFMPGVSTSVCEVWLRLAILGDETQVTLLGSLPWCPGGVRATLPSHSVWGCPRSWLSFLGW